MMDIFTGKTTFGAGPRFGEVDCELTYVPKSVDHILVPQTESLSGYIYCAAVQSLVGKIVTLKIFLNTYYKTTDMSNAAAACNGSGGAVSHGKHTPVYTYTGCSLGSPIDEPLGPIRINYTVA